MAACIVQMQGQGTFSFSKKQSDMHPAAQTCEDKLKLYYKRIFNTEEITF